jgi:hypothetical protein
MAVARVDDRLEEQIEDAEAPFSGRMCAMRWLSGIRN